MQPVVIGIEPGGTVKKGTRMLDGTGGDLRLRRGELQTDIARQGICSPHVKLGRVLQLAIELVGVSELGHDIRVRVADGFQLIDRFAVIAGLAVIAPPATRSTSGSFGARFLASSR